MTSPGDLGTRGTKGSALHFCEELEIGSPSAHRARVDLGTVSVARLAQRSLCQYDAT